MQSSSFSSMQSSISHLPISHINMGLNDRAFVWTTLATRILNKGCVVITTRTSIFLNIISSIKSSISHLPISHLKGLVLKWRNRNNSNAGTETHGNVDCGVASKHVQQAHKKISLCTMLSQSNRSKPPPVTFIDYYPEFKLGVPKDHCRATPLFDVASVLVDSNQFKGLKYVKIYGTIVLIDDHGNEFYIFDCKNRDDAKTLILDQKTPTCVVLQNFQPRGVPSKFCLLFQLKRRLHGDANEDTVIFDDYKYIDCTEQVLYDKPQEVVFHNDQSFITVTYTIFQCALLAEVGIKVEKTSKDDQSGVAGITGDIVALTRGLSDDNVCTLLDVSCEKFDFGNYTPLATLAVPAYS
ncbi:hypothetical protein POM88_010335 [Heracleum sosnowskyi]|uniref:DUF6598 domain-containing protein n=1 Tax=Heracleum sosnowskyi TaxID=360622 RepID=A0AAD8MZU9_9APIA|nr:hypothetical protein POM88_010335 [Heracleum sosnowskyi]